MKRHYWLTLRAAGRIACETMLATLAEAKSKARREIERGGWQEAEVDAYPDRRLAMFRRVNPARRFRRARSQTGGSK